MSGESYTALAGIDQHILTNFMGFLVGKELGCIEYQREGDRMGSLVGYTYKQNGGEMNSESVWWVNILHWLALFSNSLPILLVA